MGRVFNKKINSILTLLLLSGITFALDSEYKNSLTKIELTKNSENNYSVNLHTQNKFSEPIRVIKKSDLNYYILLPETKDIATYTLSDSNEIRNISTNSYQYAGMDKANNGYTKININTTKPINFNVNIKNETQEKVATQKTEEKIAIKEANIEENKTQKKNLVSSQEKKLNKKLNENIIVQKAAKIKAKQEKAIPRPDLSEIVQNYPSSQSEEIKSIEPIEDIKETENIKEEDKSTFEEFLKSDDLKEIEEIAKSKQFSNTLSDKLSEYGLTIKDAILMLLAGLLSFIVMLFVLNKKPNQTKLKSKADLIEKLDKQDGLIGKDSTKEEKGQYFIFDKNVKQTGFCSPATKKKYELSSYDPELRNNYEKTNVEKYKNKNDKSNNGYDIIQKILKEDSLLTVETENNHETKERKPVNNEPIAIKQQTQEKQEEIHQEPVVLSSVEIAPERGFMCVSYNDNINFMGYIFDDVFPLHNFKQPKLENYDIKFRLSEKDDKGANFIIKVGNARLLTRVTKNSMNLEVVM